MHGAGRDAALRPVLHEAARRPILNDDVQHTGIVHARRAVRGRRRGIALAPAMSRAPRLPRRADRFGRPVAVLAPPLLVAAVGLLALLALRQVSLTRQSVDRAHRVVESSSRVLVRLLDAETGQRGYLLTGDEKYLAPYDSARAQIPLAFARLRDAVSDDPAQRLRVDSLSVLAVAKLAELRATIDLRHAGRAADALSTVHTDRGSVVMNDVRRLVADIAGAAERQLAVGAAAERHSAERSSVLLAIVTALAVLVSLWINLVVSRESTARAVALAERQQALSERQLLLERERAARREAEVANEAKSQFLTTMSHELRTPLNAIAGYVDLMLLGIRGDLNAEQREDLRRIKRAGQHLLALINDILNYARLEAGQVELRLDEVALDETLAGLEALIAPQVRLRGLAFRYDPCAAMPRVRADREKLQQVLLNLLTNAIKFTDSGGSITMACHVVDGTARIAIADTGRGVPPDRLTTIFEPFVQIDRHRTQESQQGLGLGLAISRDLARAMGGDISVVSTLGAGSTFTVSVPLAGSG
ncbi:MAG TPA: CHASE3 domain-containing protein [Gemmatimonadaceae bacterium]|nr:CHASE3 domain-containing protein [Gemmatimonadaceae bacterium]